MSFLDRLNSIVVRAGGPTKASAIAGVTRATLWNWTSGKSEPTFSAAVALCTAAGASLEWLAHGAEKREPSTDAVLAEVRDHLALVEANLSALRRRISSVAS